MLPDGFKFLVDESTGVKVVHALRIEGFDVQSVFESFPGISDTQIIQYAYNDGRIIITNDKDFGELIYRKQMPAVGVILLRLKDESSENKIKIVLEVIDKYITRLKSNFIVATENNIRIRPL